MGNEKQVEHRNADVIDSWAGGPRLKKNGWSPEKENSFDPPGSCCGQ